MKTTTGTRHSLLLALFSVGCAGGGPAASGEPNQETSSSQGTSSGSQAMPTDSTTSGTDGQIVDEDNDGNPDCLPGVVAGSQVSRLRNKEYDRTLRDLLGVTGLTASNGAPPSGLLATDTTGSLSDFAWSSYQTVAEMVAAQVMTDPVSRAKFIACDPAVAGCLDSTISSFGRRAFRRPLSPEEVTAFKTLAQPAHTPNGTAEEMAELVLFGFLVSPSFLMVAQMSETPSTTGGDFALSSHEVAARLSYMLWGTMPDSVLDEAADGGQLETHEQILAQAKRLLGDDKAREVVAEFHRTYLHMGLNTRWDTFIKEPTRFPEFNEGLRAVFQKETEMFFDDVVFSGGSFSDLFLSTKGFVTAETAALYGIDSSGFSSELSPADLPGRQGFLTRLGFLNAFSQAARTSPILRGAFIAKDILGTKIAPPPPGAEGTPLPDSAELLTNRERVDAQTSDSVCMECHHEVINPPGFVMEAFDTMGRLQSAEADTRAPIDTTATVKINNVPTPVSNPTELMDLIAISEGARYFYAQKWVGFAFDREPNSQDACTVELLSASLGANGYTILDLISDLTRSESFTVRALESGVAQ